MKKYNRLLFVFYCLFLLFIFVPCCYGQDKTSKVQSEPKDSSGVSKTIPAGQIKIYGSPSDPFLQGQVSQYIRRMFQDKNGNLWFGTNGDGVCRYDGKSFTNYTEKEGLTNKYVQSILEDRNVSPGEVGVWFGASGGLFRFDGKSFTNIKKTGPWPF
jgi:hypothetical protein